MKKIIIAVLIVGLSPLLRAQDIPNSSKVGVWLPLQLVPSMTILSASSGSHFGFEWEATPVLYSFGISRYVSPWYAFIVEPTARFTGSVELQVAGQVFTTKPGVSYFASSVHLMGYVPLIERGEHLTLNLGVGAYQLAGQNRIVKVAGISTLFGILHLNLKHADSPTTWIGSLEFRVF